MDYNQKEKIKDIQQFISTHTVDKSNIYKEQEALEANFKWNASLFFAKVIHLAETTFQELTVDQFEEFKKKYEQEIGKTIDTEKLFQKYWLRTVLGKVKIAGTVSSACFSFNKIFSFKKELEFLAKEFPEGKEGSSKITKAEFDLIRSNYEKNNDLTLDDNGLYEQNWLSAKDTDVVQISNINYYFKPYLDSWEEFQFLSAYKDQIPAYEDHGLKIEKSSFDKLHKSFCQFYPKTAPIKKLLTQRVLKSDGAFYFLNFLNTEPRYWSTLEDQITAHYWQLLIDDNSLASDEDKIKLLLNKILPFGWPTDFLLFVPDESKKRFLDAAIGIIANEKDLNEVECEFRKVSIDTDFGSSKTEALFHNQEDYDDFSLNKEDYFELLESLNKWEEKAQTTYLHGQRSRKEISFLIKMIVTHDYEVERKEKEEQNTPTIYFYKRIFTLFEQALDKPVLLWNIKSYILMSRRDFLPYLIIDKKYTSMAFKLIDDMGEYFSEDERGQNLEKLWMKSMNLALPVIRSIAQESDSAKLVFQIYRQLNRDKYFIPYHRQEKHENRTRKEKEKKELAVLSLIENSLLFNHKVYGNYEHYLIPEIFNNLIDLFITLNSKPLYNNGTISFPMLQWDGLVWLMKCSTYWKYKNQFGTKPANIYLLTNTFFKLYIDRIEIKEVNKYDFSLKKEVKGLPLWSEKIERLGHIDWIYPIYFIHGQQKLNSFLEPRLDFNTATNKYDKENQFRADKLRTHIGVLLQILRKLIIPAIPYGFEKENLAEIKSKIEQQIIDYIKRHTKEIPEEGRVDLFDYNRELAFNSSEKESLLPQIARALYWFNKKEALIEAIIASQDVIKVLTVMKWTTSEGIRQKLFKKIQQSDIQSFLEKTHWIPEIQQALLEMVNYPGLIDKINPIIDFWEQNISKKETSYQTPLYQAKMLLAYHDKNEIELDSIKDPEKKASYSSNELTHKDHKQFYRALIKLESDPESSYQIFKDLSSRYTQYPVLALNQMAAKIDVAKANGDKLELYKEALEEWKVYVSKNEIEEESLSTTFITNKLIILYKLQDFNELDEVYDKLDLPYQMLPNTLEVKINSLIDRERIGEALFILENAENYHGFSGIENISFIDDLKNKVNGIDNIKELLYQYNRIFNSSPSKLIKILPEKMNGRIEISEFVVKEVARAASNMLDKVHALPEILKLNNTSKENRFNDLVQLALESRISTWGWSVKDQTRKAFSPSEKDLGEIDIDIRDNNQKSFITCEAFILRDVSRVQSHLEKLISHYTHQRSTFLTLVYFQGKQSDFQKEWENYHQTTLLNIAYPNGYELDPNKVKDVSKEFGYDLSGIRVGKTTLNSGSTIFHLFVNIKYQLN